MEAPIAPEEEVDTESPSSDQSAGPSPQPSPDDTDDAEVAAWVQEAVRRRQRGISGTAQKPALHAVALDAVAGSPLLEDPSTISPTA